MQTSHRRSTLIVLGLVNALSFSGMTGFAMGADSVADWGVAIVGGSLIALAIVLALGASMRRRP